jgi:hypothetical protein
MHSSALLTVLLATSAAVAQTTTKPVDAKVVTDNPPNTLYVSSFKDAGTEKITGWVNASTDASGKGVDFTISIQGLMADKGPFRTSTSAVMTPVFG